MESPELSSDRRKLTAVPWTRLASEVPRELSGLRSVVCPTGKLLSAQRSVNVPSVTPDLLLGTHYLLVCNQTPTITGSPAGLSRINGVRRSSAET